jgi:uncharacterized protein
MQWRRRLARLPLGGVVLAVLSILVIVVISTVNFGAGLSHVDVKMLSGSPGGNYGTIVERVSKRAAKRGGKIENVATQGSVDNVRRLVDHGCENHFALMQDGIPLPEGSEKLELIGRLPRGETMFVIGRDAARLTKFAELKGMKIGLGPKGSGTDYLGRSVFEAADLAPAGLVLSNHELGQQLELLTSGALDLGVFVLDEDAALINTAIRERKMQLISLDQLDVIPTRVPMLSLGTIPAGRYDTLALIPERAHQVLRVDTLVVGNGCASRSVEIGVLRVLVEELPGFGNNDHRASPLRRSAVAKEFLSSDGPGFADEYVPWLVDIMPLGNWFYIVMIISVLFNATTLWHKVRLWRIDANRDKAFQIVRDALGDQLTTAEIEKLVPTEQQRTSEMRDRIDRAIKDLDALRAKTRRQENSMLVPLGAEWMYRFEEEQMEALLTSLRTFRLRLE